MGVTVSRMLHIVSRARVPSLVAVVAAIAFILALTLRPGDGLDTAGWSVYRVGEHGLASALLNVALFVPLGLALAARGVGPLRAVAMGALLSLGIELAQLFIAGRYSTVADVLLNTGGTGVGVLLHRAVPVLIAPGSGAARRLAFFWAAGLVALTALAGILNVPALGDEELFVQWTPDLGGMTRFHGQVLDLSVGDMAVGERWMEEPVRFRHSFLAGATIRIRVSAGGPSHGLAPVVRVVNPGNREILMLGVHGDELVLRFRTRAAAVRLHQPEIRTGGIPGSGVIDVVAVRDGKSYCLGTADSATCGLGTTAGRSWAFLRGDGALPPPTRRLADLLWIGLLFLPLGFWARRDLASIAAVAVALGGLVLLPFFLSILATPAAEAFAAAGGVVAGGGLRGRARAARGWVERVLHPLRRRRARSVVARAPADAPILVVCTGNICRSPYAAEALRRELGRAGLGAVAVWGAGFIQPGRRPPRAAVAVVERRGIELTGHSSALVDADLVREASLVVVMDRRHRASCAHLFGRRRDVVLLGDLDPDHRPPSRAILDPVDRDEPVFEEVYARIDRCVAELVRVLARAGGHGVGRPV